MPPARPNHRSTKNGPGNHGKKIAGRFGGLQQFFLLLMNHGAKEHAPHERGDKATAASKLCRSKAEHGKANNNQLTPGGANQTIRICNPKQLRSEPGDTQAADRPDTNFLN